MDPAKVLVVDDERSILLLLKEALSQWGYQVTVASSAADALNLLKSELFDALITDIRMPDMSGLELLREVKKQDESIEVVMMTGYPTIASAVQALKEGAYDYLSKPLILDELRHLMSRMMERKFLRGEVSTLRARLGEELTVNELIGTSVPMERVKEVIKLSSPRTKNKVELYEDKVPLFHRYGIEREIELMYSRHVPLPSGGSLVIDSTEAIVAIDVNSGKFRDHSDAEMTAFKTDMEAADEIPRQLKLRDLRGAIICDFIDQG